MSNGSWLIWKLVLQMDPNALLVDLNDLLRRDPTLSSLGANLSPTSSHHSNDVIGSMNTLNSAVTSLSMAIPKRNVTLLHPLTYKIRDFSGGSSTSTSTGIVAPPPSIASSFNNAAMWGEPLIKQELKMETDPGATAPTYSTLTQMSTDDVGVSNIKMETTDFDDLDALFLSRSVSLSFTRIFYNKYLNSFFLYLIFFCTSKPWSVDKIKWKTISSAALRQTFPSAWARPTATHPLPPPPWPPPRPWRTSTSGRWTTTRGARAAAVHSGSAGPRTSSPPPFPPPCWPRAGSALYPTSWPTCPLPWPRSLRRTPDLPVTLPCTSCWWGRRSWGRCRRPGLRTAERPSTEWKQGTYVGWINGRGI